MPLQPQAAPFTVSAIPNGSITNAKLQNSSVTINGTAGHINGGGTVSLGGSLTLSLPNVGTAGTYGGGGSYIQSLTTDAQGRVSAITTASSPTLYYQTVQAADVDITQRGKLDFASVFAVTDDAGSNRTKVTVASGAITNAMLQNSSVTVSAGAGLATTSASISLGGSATLSVGGTADATYSTGAFTWSGASGKNMALTSSGAGTITLTAAAASTWDTANGTIKVGTLDATSGTTIALGGTASTLSWASGATRTINIATPGTADTAGNQLSVTAGSGSAASATAGGAGGTLLGQGGNGGAGSASKAGGAGGASVWRGGDAGTNAGAGSGAGGSSTLRAGSGAAASGSSAATAGGNTIVQASTPGDGSTAAAGATAAAVQITGQGGGLDNGGGGGAGSALTVTTGIGRTGASSAVTGTTANNGTAGGLWGMTWGGSGNGGAGGTNLNAGSGGSSGTSTWSGGAGGAGGAAGTGTSNGGAGGNGVSWSHTTGAGGSGGSGATGTNGGNGGTGGAYTVATANGGNGGAAGTGSAGTGGAAGAISFTTGNAGTGGNVNAANISFQVGTATGSGTVGSVNINTTRGNVSMGASGSTITVTGALSQSTGAVSLTANAASSFTTSSGALTITAAAASTWDSADGTVKAATLDRTTAGTLTIAGTATAITVAANTTWNTQKAATLQYTAAGAARQVLLTAQNTQAATSSVQQWSPAQEFVGHGWGYLAASTSSAGNATRSGTTVTVTTTSAHGLTNGNQVYVATGADSATIPAGLYTLTSASGSSLTFTTAGSGTFTSTVTWSVYDATGQDQTVRVSAHVRPVLGKRYADNLVNNTQAAADLTFYRSSYPNNGAAAEWFTITSRDVAGSPNNSTGGAFPANGGLTIQTLRTDGVTAGSFLQLGPGYVALYDDGQYAGTSGNACALISGNNGVSTSTPNQSPYWQSCSVAPGVNGQASTVGTQLGTPALNWHDFWGVRANAANLGLGDVATTNWGAATAASPASPTQATTISGYTSPVFGWNAAAAAYGLYQLGGASRFKALSDMGTVTVTVTGGGSGTTWNYKVVAVDRNGYTTLASANATASNNGTLDATHYNTLSWTAVTGALRYDIYGISGASAVTVTQANWIGTVTGTTFKDTGAARYVSGQNGAPGSGGVAAPTNVQTSGYSTGGGNTYTYHVYAVDFDGHLTTVPNIASTTNANALGTSSAVTINWSPVGGAVYYVVTRGGNTLPIYQVTKTNGFSFNVAFTGGGSGTVSRAGSTVTVTCANVSGQQFGGHGLRIGDTFTVTSNDANFPSGTYTVATTSSVAAFTYTDAGSATTSLAAGKTFTAANTNLLLTDYQLVDYGYATRTIGSASRNTTADVTVDGNVTMSGAQFVHRTTVADAAYTTLTSDYIVAYTSLSAARTVTGTTTGSTTSAYTLVIKDESGSASIANAITFTPSSGNVDGVSSKVIINQPYQAVTLYCNGTNWFTEGCVVAPAFTEVAGGIGFSNSWVNLNSTTGEKASYTKDASGVVHLRGIIASGTVGQAAFTLPAGYRPIGRRQFAVNTSPNAFGMLEINPSGAVIPQTGSNTYFYLDCSWVAEQ